MVHAARKLRRPSRVKVGEHVGISVGGRVLGAEVIEDRGDLGADGQQVVRLAVKDAIDPADAYEVEVPVEWLLAAPARPRAGR
jgi:hypothetical protein